MPKKFVLALIFFAVASPACRRPIDIPNEFPTPPMPAAAKPIPKIEYKRDAQQKNKDVTPITSSPKVNDVRSRQSQVKE